MKITVFRNCKILRNHKFMTEDLWVRDGKIINPEKVFFDEKQEPNAEIFCNGALISPGLLDIQINGGYGVDFSSDVHTVEKGLAKVSQLLLQHGTTSFCPTIVTSPVPHYHAILPRIKRSCGGSHGATILGVHVEGPFINVEKKGAHPPGCIIDFENGFDTLLATYGTLDDISIITLAPEKIKTEEVIKELRKRNITVSLGHSMADLCDGERAVKSGASLITHLFNAMLPFHHRDPGLVGLLSSDQIPKDKTVYFGIISDGVHTHPAALRIAYRTHPMGLILVTDAISAMGLPEGFHQIGQMNVEVRDRRGYIAGTNTLCGSIAPMDECIRIFRKATNCTIEYALEAASLHPATCLGIEKQKGTLNYGADADLVFFDEDLIVWSSWIAGECVYQNENVKDANYIVKEKKQQ